ncbi:ferredoxin [Myxococcota bacterium]|nr:ferredoxin [Myxococcota bacterium]
MRIQIDRERCMGSGSCQFHAPDTFDLDADCKAIVVDDGTGDDQAIRNAAENCPTHAIVLVEATETESTN